jgi:4-hydroxybenzoate polyprenyltransferase
MIRRLRLLVLVARPAVVILLGLFAATGVAQAGLPLDGAVRSVLPLTQALAVVIGFLLFSVVCNDLADEAIDRVNLPHDAHRPLVAGTADRREMAVVGTGAAAAALVASVTMHWPALIVTAAGLAVSFGYSVRPVRLADRGAVASTVLPACYVAVPYLLGIFAVRGTVRPDDLVLLAGLYVGFIGRILLKDFRDVRGDALFGKRTFLVRHGRYPTCALSGCCWLVGAVLLLCAVRRPTVTLTVAYGVMVAIALLLLRLLSTATSPRREEALIAAIAIVGRGMILILMAHLSMTDERWSALGAGVVLGALTTLIAGQAAAMAWHGPVGRVIRLPAAFAAAAPAGPSPVATSTPATRPRG